MWLLSTSRAELHYFPDTRSLPSSFAILSHTWSKSEQTFQVVRSIGARAKRWHRNPRKHVSAKIRNCCIIAERDGYDWVWIDSCCIDRSSSTELSEAINSMFDWYVLAEVCYVYLEDVDMDPEENPTEFLEARWYTRGWTLQELLAPEVLVFLSADWKPIGTKRSLCSLVSEATGIDEKYLTREWDMFQASVGRRMSWASKRKTTRVEDEAYCLLGIFSINMPTLYGEGRRAFQRLQLEIVKQSQDTTLLAWGDWDSGTLDPVDRSSILSYSPSNAGPSRFLLAPSPSVYISASDKSYTPRLSESEVLQPYLPSQWSHTHDSPATDAGAESNQKQKGGPFRTIELPSFKATSYGMECHFPVGEVDGITVAVLLVETLHQHVGLFLFPAPEHEALDPARDLFYTSWTFNDAAGRAGLWRLAPLGSDLYNLRYRGRPLHVSWKTIYIRTASDGPYDRVDVAWTIFNGARAHGPPAPFRLSRSTMGGMSALGLAFESGRLVSLKSESQPQVWYKFIDPTAVEDISVHIGVCVVLGERYIWAYAMERHTGTWGTFRMHCGHDCATDHITNWPNQTRIFGDQPKDRHITLWFTDCRHTPGIFVFHLQLGGCVYEGMLRKANITFPSSPEVIPTTAIPRGSIAAPAALRFYPRSLRLPYLVNFLSHGDVTRSPPVDNQDDIAIVQSV